jgi:hypothetical protein
MLPEYDRRLISQDRSLSKAADLCLLEEVQPRCNSYASVTYMTKLDVIAVHALHHRCQVQLRPYGTANRSCIAKCVKLHCAVEDDVPRNRSSLIMAH